MNKSASITKLAEALSKAQAEMPVVKMNAQNPFLKNKYADLGAVIETSRPILSKNNLSISQFPTSEGDKIGVTSLLMHSSGEWVEDTIFINPTDSKGLSFAQTAGIVISYLRRYAWASILGLYADEDNDGHTKDAQPKAESKQPAQVTKKPNEIITDSEWEAFTKLVEKAQSMNIKLPEYDRSKMKPDTFNGQRKYIYQEIEKKEKAGK